MIASPLLVLGDHQTISHVKHELSFDYPSGARSRKIKEKPIPNPAESVKIWTDRTDLEGENFLIVI